MPTLPYTYQEFLQILNDNNDVLEGYYANSRFYKDAEHTDAYTGALGVLYVDVVTHGIYVYNGTQFVATETIIPKTKFSAKRRIIDVVEVGSNRYMAVSSNGVYGFTSDFSSWEWSNNLLPVSSIAFAASTHITGSTDYFVVAVSTNGKVFKLVSTGWEQCAALPFTSVSVGVTVYDYAKSRPIVFVLSKNNDKAAISVDGCTTWVERTLPVSGAWLSITASSQDFFVISKNTALRMSWQGVSDVTSQVISSSPLPEGINWGAISFGNGKNVVLSTNMSKVAISSGILNWTVYDTARGGMLSSSIIYANNRFVAVGRRAKAQGTSMVSTDGQNWTPGGAIPSTSFANGIVYKNGAFIALPNSTGSNILYYSDDGLLWSNTISVSSMVQRLIDSNVFDRIQVLEDKVTTLEDRVTALETANNTPDAE